MKKLLMLVGVTGASLSAIFVRWSTAPSLILVLYRSLFATLLLAPYALWRHREELRRLRRREVALSLISGVFLGLHFACYFESLRWTSIASAVVLVDTEVFFVALATVFLLRQKLGRRAWLAIGLTFLGSVLVAMSDAGASVDALRGDLIALTGALCMAVYTMIGTVCRRTVSTTAYTVLVYGTSVVTVLAIALAGGTPLTGYGSVNLATAFGMAVCCTLLGHSVFSWGLKYLPPAFIATVKLLEPAIAALWGLLLFAERPGLLVILGSAIIIFGIALYNTSET